MPLYDFRCAGGHRFERFVKLENFEDHQLCSCSLPATRAISAPRFTVENVGYQCPITDKWIGSKKEHAENLAVHGCRVYESGETELTKASKQAEEDAFDKSIEDTVEREFEAMPSAKKERMANELLSGVDVSVDRITV